MWSAVCRCLLSHLSPLPMQAHGPLLHLHFMATLPDKQGSGLGRSLLEHLERMADAGGVVRDWLNRRLQEGTGGTGWHCRLWLPRWGSRQPADCRCKHIHACLPLATLL